MNQLNLVSDLPLSCQNIELIDGDLLNSNIYLIGEVHNSQSIIKAEKEILKKLAREEDAILLESHSSFILLNQKRISLTSSIPQDLWVMGWDDIKLVFETAQNIGDLIPLINKNEEISKTLANTPESFATLRKKICVRKAEIESAIEKIKEQNQKLVEQRDCSLVNTVAVTLKLLPKRRIFVIAGKSHFNAEVQKKLKEIDGAKVCYISLLPTEVQDSKSAYEYGKLVASLNFNYNPRSSQIEAIGPCSVLCPRIGIQEVRKASNLLASSKQKSIRPKLGIISCFASVLILAAVLLAWQNY